MTSRRSMLGLVGSVPVALALAGGEPATATATATEAKIGGELDRFVAGLAADGRFSGTLLLTYRGRPVLSRSYGMADRARAVPNGAGTLFALGSITKLFTAVAIAQLAQRGVVSYHERVGAYLDGFPRAVAENVTVHHLLTHHSGLGDYMQSDGFWGEALTWDTVEKVWDGSMRHVRREEPASAPGTAYRYSNTGYHILGAIVAAVSGRSYHDHVREHVFRRAGLSTVDFYATPQWRDDRRIAKPYGTPARVDVLDRHVFVGSPAGGAFATAPDLARFAAALHGGRLLDAAYTHLVHGAKEPVGRRRNPLGAEEISYTTYAPMAILSGGQWFYWHNGGAPGVSTELSWYPTSGWTAAILSNYDQSTAPIDTLVRTLVTTR